MKYGVLIFPTDYSIDPVTLGKEAEARGLDSIWFPEHTHIPASRVTPWPGGADLPQDYWHCMDPFIALSAVASVTSKIRLGTGICLVVEHDPIALAKQVASLDYLSDGRFLFGVGAGWNVEEMANHGTDFKRRWKVQRERIEAMKEIWTKDDAEYHGEFVDFDPIWSWPKPKQAGGPPVYVGGDGPGTFKRVIRYGDAWMPIGVRLRASIEEKMAELQSMAADAGRGPIPVAIYGVAPQPEVVNSYLEAGVDEVIFWMPSVDESQAMQMMDAYSGVMNAVAKAGA
ncbi:MAG TPA: LLM class F420-dependent oxidoreductase [Dehalococcoidia bacterium]|nr:LLM class F420-dependent oxidoreductase [Dehalococcoidia bacterium]